MIPIVLTERLMKKKKHAWNRLREVIKHGKALFIPTENVWMVDCGMTFGKSWEQQNFVFRFLQKNIQSIILAVLKMG